MSFEILTVSLKWLKVYGGNPFEPFSTSSLIKFILTCFFGAFGPAVLAIYELHVKGTSLETLGNFAEGFGSCYQTAWKAYIVYTQKDNFTKAYEAIGKFICANTNKDSRLGTIIEETHLRALFFYKIYMYFILIAGTMFAAKPILFFERILPAGFDFKCDLENNICYFVNWIYQAFTTAYVATFVVGFDGIFFGLVSFAAVELEAIKHELLNLVDDNGRYEDAMYMKKLAKIVKHHNHVLRFIKLVSQLYKLFFLHQLGSSMFGICIAIFEINLEVTSMRIPILLKYVTFLVAYYAQLFVYCTAGEHLMNQTFSVADAAYNCKWHIKHLPKVTKGLMMIIQRSSKAVKLSIGDMYDLNLQIFASIARTSFSIVALMRTMYEE